MKREFGIGGIGGGQAIEIDAITKYETENRQSVRWYIEIGGERIEVTTQQLLDQRQLQKLCVEKLNKCPSTMPGQRWEQRINELLTSVEVILDPDDASPQGQFEKMLDSFLTGKVQARQRDEIMNGKPWHDIDDGKVYFRSEDLFIYVSQNVARAYVRALGGFQATIGAAGTDNKGTQWYNGGGLSFDGVKIAVANGLPDNTMVAAEKSNLFFGTGLLNDQNEVKVIDMADIDGSQNVRVVMRYTAAVQYGLGSEIVLYS